MTGQDDWNGGIGSNTEREALSAARETDGGVLLSRVVRYDIDVVWCLGVPERSTSGEGEADVGSDGADQSGSRNGKRDEVHVYKIVKKLSVINKFVKCDSFYSCENFYF